MSSTWQKLFSKTYQKDYWFNLSTGEKSWEPPDDSKLNVQSLSTSSSVGSQSAAVLEVGLKRRRQDESEIEAGNNIKISNIIEGHSNQIAIIVPFRDLHHQQNRSKHLNAFIPEMIKYLSSSSHSFAIYIIQQSLDNRKFNRGKLLNIGYDIAKKENSKIFIFHDVDLIPSLELLPRYTSVPAPGEPVHIARVWNRYSANDNYFGGIVAFSSEQFEAINGFPNNFWGWGGEDDEMFKRVKAAGLTPTFPVEGSIKDMEDMDLPAKLQVLRKNRLWKCMNKVELLEEHSATWTTNGLRDLKYDILDLKLVNEHTKVITVDVHTNDHWTDLVCGINDTQLDTPVEELRRKFKNS